MARVPDVSVRTFSGERDIEAWLELRRRAFANERPAVRPWSGAAFSAEFLDKPWWSHERLWFAEAAGQAIGSVTLAMRGDGASTTPVVHWLMVVPEWRRRGVGRLLITTLEAASWEAGYRQIALETHANWTAAAAFYRALGYAAAGLAP